MISFSNELFIEYKQFFFNLTHSRLYLVFYNWYVIRSWYVWRIWFSILFNSLFIWNRKISRNHLFFSKFSEVNRTQIYFNFIIEDVYNKISSNKIVQQTCSYIVIVWQIFACLFMILFFDQQAHKNKRISFIISIHKARNSFAKSACYGINWIWTSNFKW